MRLAFILGTRPEIIKMFPILKECERTGIDYFVIHSGQHFSRELSDIFFEELGLREPEYNLGASRILANGVVERISNRAIFENPDGCVVHGKQLGVMLGRIEEVLYKESPSCVMVLGDTNTTLAGALAAVKLHLTVCHVEAGLRSYNNTMPEEINRILTDRISDLLFCPTKLQERILLSEGIGRPHICVTGNTIVDVVSQSRKRIEDSAHVLDELGLEPKGYFLLTLHREENVDDERKLEATILSVGEAAKEFDVPIVFPIHPRTELRLQERLTSIASNINLTKPLDYFRFLALEENAKLILTDSGGVQEEACILKVPCITLRDTTERPETIDVGSNILSGINMTEILSRIKYMLLRDCSWKHPFGDGTASKKILAIISERVH